ncbi:MAG TPA: glycosyltransferase [Chthoniobacterales bacterium]
MRLLHVFQTLNPATGGPVEAFKQSLVHFLERGWSIDVVSLDPPNAPFLASDAARVHAIGPGRTGYGYSPSLVKWLKANANAYDCVIVHGIWGFPTFGTWLALRNSETPYMVVPHGMLDPWFKHAYPLKHVKKWLYYLFCVGPVLRDAAGVVFTCDVERVLARKSFTPYRCNEVVIRFGTFGIPDPTHNYAGQFLARNPSLAGKRIFLFLGRVHPKKGPDLLLHAIHELQKSSKWDPTSMRLVIAGPSDGDYAKRLRNLAVSKNVQESVYWTGMLEGNEKWGAVQAAEAFVLPSHQENFGVAVAECLSAGVPVLITHSINISPEIEADRAGLVEMDTISGCIRLLEQWIGLDPTTKLRMRQQARQTFEQRYTSAGSAEDLGNAIEASVVCRRPRGLCSQFPAVRA